MSEPTAPPLDDKLLVRDDRIHASRYADRRIFEDEMERITSPTRRRAAGSGSSTAR